MAFPDGIADFRSDTVTRPTAEMRRAMAEAEVGDDVYGEDPTVNALEEESAAALGKQAALFVPTGTMGNQLAINLHTRPGEEVLCVERAHVRNYERGAGAAISGVGFRTIASEDGSMDPEAVRRSLEEAQYHLPDVTLMVWENTHNVSGGTVVPLSLMEASSSAAREGGLAIHLDGARLWNAAVASGTPAAEFAAVADSVMFCFSKGLGAPVGSILCAPTDFIAAARPLRKRFGGGMRQAGVIAAAARVALADWERLADDHDLAAELATGLGERFPEALPAAPQSNMVLVDEVGLPFTAADFVSSLREDGVLVGFIRPGMLRFCTHRDVDRADTKRVLSVADALAS